MVSQGESADRGGSLTQQQSLTPPPGLPPSAGKRPEGPRFRKLRHKHRTCHDRGTRTLSSPPHRALSPVYNPVVVADRERGTSGAVPPPWRWEEEEPTYRLKPAKRANPN
ncbi:hypothetical protein HPB47_004751 [Ixodes persulcatus]|uniref:Uncharacterized protein n=1 Tax=Ixodes persulcatus TaxID=34615 RepID=A0AC60PG52_IXOPE|nr:hypothetical protein HPB47_004751 [Ixodes persulcatus]